MKKNGDKADVKSSNKTEINWAEIEERNYEQMAKNLTNSMFPDTFSEYIFQEAKAINNTSPDYLAVSVLVSAASLIGGSAKISPKEFDKSWEIKPTLWAMVVGDPSSYKTPLMNKGLAPLRHAQDKLDKALDSGGDTLSSSSDGYEKEDIIVTDATPEALLVKLQSHPRGVLLFRDELSGVFAAMTKSGREHERALLLEGFNASDSPYTQERIGRDKVVIECVHLNLLGGIQPKILTPILKARKDGKEDDGFLERIQLAVYPEINNLTYTDIVLDDKIKEKTNDIFLKLAQLRNREHVTFNFDKDAQLIWNDWSIKFHDSLTKLTTNEQSMEVKYPALLAKLSLVFHICSEAGSCNNSYFNPDDKIKSASINMALEWLDYLRSHSSKISSLVSSNTDPSVDALINNLPKLNGSFTKQKLGQKDWKHLTNSVDRNRAILFLEEFGYIKLIDKPNKHYIIHPKFC